MKYCPQCKITYQTSFSQCPACQFKPKTIDGFESYVCDLDSTRSGFQSSHFSKLAALEDENFWFRSRNELIIWALEKFCPAFQSLLEIGCGTGFVLSGINSRFKDKSLYGSEIFTEGLSFAAERVSSAKLMHMDARQIPFLEEFDVVGLFDVLEHIKEDTIVLDEIFGALKQGGHLLLTVPQHDWLWSPTDDYACHERRYSATDLHTKLRAANFTILRSTSFVSLLLPAMLLSRSKRSKSDQTGDSSAELNLPKALNILLYKIMQTEIALIKAKVDFPLGGSRLVIAKKA